jgi:signal transduction histidine kinase
MSAVPLQASPPGLQVWLQRWLPRSLFGRLVLVLAGGLFVAQLLSAAINAAERERLVAGSFGMQPAQRIADVVKLLDALGDAERAQVVAVLRVPPLVLSLADAPRVRTDAATGWQAAMFATRLRAALGDEREVRVQPREGFAPMAGMPGTVGGGASPHGRMHGGGPGMMGAGAGQAVLRTEVQLRDGRWAAFDTALPAAPQALPWRLVLSLGVLLLSVLALSYVAVRWVVRPLQRLTEAAEGLGQDLDRPALPEDGPREVQQASRAFNTMQQRLATFIHERTRILAALSHDLKTPLTRMRLRAELLDDDDLRTRFEADLKDMESMVTQTLEFMRGLGGNEPRQPVDVMALLESLQSDQEAFARVLHIEGHPVAPFVGVASLLKRGLANLIDNAVLYGGHATVRIEDSAAQLVLHVLDEGPGVAEAELERVFEPFYRLETSRSRATGGTGLGLGIARNIARTHGGDVVLLNRAEGGLDAVMSLPRGKAQP